MEIKQCSPESSMGQGRNKEIKDILKFNEADHTTYPNLWDTMKATLRGKFIALNAYIKNLEKSHTSELTEHLKTLEQKEVNLPKRTRWQEIIKLRAEIYKLETKKTIQRINEIKSCFIKKNQQNRQTFIQTNQKVVKEYPN